MISNQRIEPLWQSAHKLRQACAMENLPNFGIVDALADHDVGAQRVIEEKDLLRDQSDAPAQRVDLQRW
ncbi:hypothetical protein D3C84_1277020 [compost metagenome]